MCCTDGRSTPEVVAAAAARAGLKFIVITDHGDATRIPDAPVYRDGVLCLDAVEISTKKQPFTTGHDYVVRRRAACERHETTAKHVARARSATPFQETRGTHKIYGA